MHFPAFTRLVSNMRVRLAIITIGIFLIASVPSFYFYQKYKTSEQLLRQPAEAAKEENKALLATIGKIIELPTNEQPTIATVTDKDKLKTQSFFANAQNGDKVLVYNKAKKAILYRPSTNKIIEVAPVTLASNQTPTPSAQVASSKYSVTLRNGTPTSGLTGLYEAELATKAGNFRLASVQNAARTTYGRTVLIDVSGKHTSDSQKLAQVLGISISSLPIEEATPASDFLIILGKDKEQ